MGVKIGVAGAGVAVVERRRHQANHRHLPDAALADAGEGDLPLEQADRRPNRCLVGRSGLAGHLG